jgi:hypothetical protein
MMMDSVDAVAPGPGGFTILKCQWAGRLVTSGTVILLPNALMDSSKDRTLEELIERSRSLIRQADELKRLQETLLRDLEQLRERKRKPGEG